MFILPTIDDANDAEGADAADVASGGDKPTVFPGGVSHGQTACEPARGDGEL